MRLVQLSGAGGRRVALVDGDELVLLDRCVSVHELAQIAFLRGEAFSAVAESHAGAERTPYEAVWSGASADWALLPCVDHPLEPARCLVSGTGLTHRKSASNRQAMHASSAEVTDSMRMYQWGVEGGRPAIGTPGAAPEWFYKGNGSVLRGHNEPLEVPPYAEDGGEEPEIAGVYWIDDEGMPRRLGMATGNEFSDHVFEKRNYLYLAASKLRTCSIGPELVTDPDFSSVQGQVAIERAGQTVWCKSIRSGEEAMCHSLANIEHHHFKFEGHRRPGDIHVHFFGADAFSFGDGVELQDGDIMEVQWEGFGRPLRNMVRRSQGENVYWAASRA